MYIKWSLVLKHVCAGGGGGNVTFGVYIYGFPPIRWCQCGILYHFGV